MGRQAAFHVAGCCQLVSNSIYNIFVKFHFISNERARPRRRRHKQTKNQAAITEWQCQTSTVFAGVPKFGAFSCCYWYLCVISTNSPNLLICVMVAPDCEFVCRIYPRHVVLGAIKRRQPNTRTHTERITHEFAICDKCE